MRANVPEFKRALLLGVGVVCMAAAFGLVMIFGGQFGADTSNVREIDSSKSVSESSYDGKKWMIYVTGAVRTPGVYEIKPGSRTNDAVKMAGGFSPRADIAGINLAAKLSDEQHVHIPEKGELAQQRANATVGSSSQALAPAPSSNVGGKLDINRCSAEELIALPGIGKTLASAIVSYREKKGRFLRIEDLRNVSGIGRRKFEAIRDMITVSGR